MNKNVNMRLKYLVVPVIIGLSFWLLLSAKNNGDDKVWVEKDPIKCLGNAWEFDWFRNDPSKFSNYPKGELDVIDGEEIVILKDYYKKNNINILDVRSKTFGEVGDEKLKTCDICSCPQGYTLYALVPFGEVEKMLELDWKRSSVKF